MSQKSKHTLTLAEKCRVIEMSNKGLSQRKLAERFNVSKTQIQSTLKSKEEILELKSSNANLEMKRIKTIKSYGDINKLTYRWFLEAVNRRIEVSGPMIQEKARIFAKDLNQDKFTASNGWLQSFVKRNGIVFGKLCGEAGDVNKDVVKNWLDDITSIIQDYEPRNIFNQDETALFFKTTQSKTFYKKGAKPGGAKKSKERVTISCCVNMEGEKERVMLIGKAKKPRFFKSVDVSKLPVDYRHNTKGWMTADLFSTFLRAFNEKMAKQKRKILLFCDNATSHKPEDLSHVTIKFLPSKTMSVLQPLDQGIIQAFKLQYRKRQYRHIMLTMDTTNKTGVEIMSAVNVLQAIMWAAEAWDDVKPETVTKCFRKAGLKHSDADPKTSNETTNEETMPKQFNKLAQDIVGCDFAELATLEEELELETEDTTETDWSQNAVSILRSLDEEKEDSDEEEDEEDVPVKPPSVADALTAFSTLKDFCSSKGLIDELRSLNLMDKTMLTTAQDSRVQSSLEAFGFLKKE